MPLICLRTTSRYWESHPISHSTGGGRDISTGAAPSVTEEPFTNWTRAHRVREASQVLCAARDPERGCITAMDPAFCVSNQEAQGFFPFCAAQSGSNFYIPSGIFPWGFLHQLGTGYGLRRGSSL